MEKKWAPCFCTILLGIAVIVFTYMQATWATTALYIAGGLVVLKGLIGACCCNFKKKCD